MCSLIIGCYFFTLCDFANLATADWTKDGCLVPKRPSSRLARKQRAAPLGGPVCGLTL